MNKNVVLIFGEDFNDAKALTYLVKALQPECSKIKPMKSPIILSRDANQAKKRKNQNMVDAVVRAEAVRGRIHAVIVHRDCDAVEPAHREQCRKLRRDFHLNEIKLVPVAPAFEMEAWWFLWPSAVAAVNARWRRLKCMQRNHGMIRNVKEQLASSLRPKTGTKTNDYSEADAPRIAEKVWCMGIIDERCGTSESFEDFAKEMAAL